MQKITKIDVSRVTLDVSKLEAIEIQLRKKFVTRVGILGAKAHGRKATIDKISKSGKHLGHMKGQEGSDLSNADIGLIHEKGSKSGKIERRSFIEMPLQLKMPRILEKVGQAVIDGLTKENIRSAYKRLGVIGENIIQGAFASRGYGRWKANAPITKAMKKSDMPLIDTAQLRKSITSQVVAK